MMTKREVFDKVKAHLLAQNERAGTRIAEDTTLTCHYRLVKSDGTVLKCAAGCLIADEAYKPELENKTVCSSIVRDALTESGVPESAFSMLRELQVLHDCEEDYAISDWPAGLDRIEAKYFPQEGAA